MEQQTGDQWTVDVEGSVMVWEFLPGMELSAFRKEAYPVYEDLLQTRDVDAMVTDIRLDDPFNAAAFEVWEQAAQRADEAGIDRWAVVAEGIKGISLRGKIDTGDLQTMATEDRAEAMAWARDADE